MDNSPRDISFLSSLSIIHDNIQRKTRPSYYSKDNFNTLLLTKH